MERPPATARYLAIAQLSAVALVVLAGMGGGALMQVELAAPGARWSAPFYSRMLTLHGLMPLAIGAAPLAGVLGYLVISRLVGARRIPAPAVAWCAFACWVIGVVVSAIAMASPIRETGWTLYAPSTLEEPSSPAILFAGPLLIGLAGATYAAHLASLVIAHRTAAPGRLAIAAALVVALGGAGLAGIYRAFELVQIVGPTQFTLAFALGLATVAIAGERDAGRSLVLIALGVALGWAVLPNVLFAGALVGLWIALAIKGGFARPVVAFALFGCGPALLLHGLASLLVIGSDVRLHDTHFIVGSLHLQMLASVFAMLAGLHAVAPRSHRIVAWIGGCTTSAGALMFGVAELAAGAAGMPRRYWDYDPLFTPHHTLATWGMGVVLLGAVIVAAAWLLGRSRA